MSIAVHLEPILYVLRIFEDDKTYGDEYVASATVKKIDDDTIEILGMSSKKKFTLEMARAVKKELKSLGFKQAVWDRKAGKDHRVIITAKKL